jgi:hypothetical protein
MGKCNHGGDSLDGLEFCPAFQSSGEVWVCKTCGAVLNLAGGDPDAPLTGKQLSDMVKEEIMTALDAVDGETHNLIEKLCESVSRRK